ncbi:MAG: hypothetical protein IT363_03755 [Methanoregulaceae archaeon]|nr:hypothetical protein [Methanoregulaceae archaeon]
MTRTMLFALTATAAVASTTYLYGQGTAVQLQPTTPGTQQVGNANISGRVLAGFVQAGSIQTENGSPNAQVIVGNATSTTGANFGGFFRSDSVLGRALYGRASATSGTTHGVWGQSDSPGGRGVTGVAPATTGNATGVWGQTASTTGRGVYGYTTNGSGVNYGVFGQSSSPTGYGVYSQGNMHASGVISGNGSGLSNVNASHLGGFASAAYLRSIPVPLSLVGSVPASGVIVGENSSTTYDSSGVLGKSTTDITAGVRGVSTANQGYGIHGESSGVYGIGVRGEATITTGGGLSEPTGGFFTSVSVGGRGVYGRASAQTGTTYGGRFLAMSTVGTGVYGEATADTGVNFGVVGSSESTSGRAVFGEAKAVTGTVYGIYGRTQSPAGRSVYGLATSAAGTPYGVLGSSGSAGWGVFAIGDMGASGTKPFRIDHPFDPENKYLLHYAAESPMPQNFYVGNVITDAQGYAWVTLPDYFGEINKNFKYQLTVISEDFVQAVISKKIKSNRFQVRTSAPNTEVSWRVDADRNDLYVRNRPAKDVVEKEGREKGTYQHPAFYGFGPERGMDYDGEPKRQQAPPASRNR